MMANNIPSYEELKQNKEYQNYSLYFPLVCGYFRLIINEDSQHNIALDYLEGGFLTSINYSFKSNYRINHLYRFNKKNYDGLIKLYKEILSISIDEIKSVLKMVNIGCENTIKNTKKYYNQKSVDKAL